MDDFTIKPWPGVISLAHRDFPSQLESELGTWSKKWERLYHSKSNDVDALWAQDVWRDLVLIRFDSINQGARALRSLGKNWSLYSFDQHRRAKLIQSKLAKFKFDRVPFDPNWVKPNFGCWSLLDENTIVASLNTKKNVPQGEYEFLEDKVIPPNRAYLKLWEAFTSLELFPKPGDHCLDMGSSPGGWTWVLQACGAKVTSVDKAALVPSIESLPGVSYLKDSAFALDPKEHQSVNWFLSDVICYPDRLYSMIKRWRDEGRVSHFLCTIKLQGEGDQEALAPFLELPQAKIWHLYHNKHELTLYLNTKSDK